jgi:hypothetical protein
MPTVGHPLDAGVDRMKCVGVGGGTIPGDKPDGWVLPKPAGNDRFVCRRSPGDGSNRESRPSQPQQEVSEPATTPRDSWRHTKCVVPEFAVFYVSDFSRAVASITERSPQACIRCCHA